jgi:hypothetical protein
LSDDNADHVCIRNLPKVPDGLAADSLKTETFIAGMERNIVEDTVGQGFYLPMPFDFVKVDPEKNDDCNVVEQG